MTRAWFLLVNMGGGQEKFNIVTRELFFGRLEDTAINHLRQSIGMFISFKKLRSGHFGHTAGARQRISQGSTIQSVR